MIITTEIEMSTGINKSFENCYIVNMNRGSLAAKLERLYLEWQLKNGRETIDAFAEFLGVSQPYLSLLMTGKRRKVGMKLALQIAERTGDYSILDELGYARPETEPVPFSSLPPDFLDLLKRVDNEISKTLRDRGITEYSAEAEKIASEILSKYGFKSTSTSKSG